MHEEIAQVGIHRSGSVNGMTLFVFQDWPHEEELLVRRPLHTVGVIVVRTLLSWNIKSVNAFNGYAVCRPSCHAQIWVPLWASNNYTQDKRFLRYCSSKKARQLALQMSLQRAHPRGGLLLLLVLWFFTGDNSYCCEQLPNCKAHLRFVWWKIKAQDTQKQLEWITLLLL